MVKKLPLVLVAHNVRSAHNVGSLFRTADGAGIESLILTGISPHPRRPNDDRPPHVIAGAERAIAKTALGAERTLNFRYLPSINRAIAELKRQGRTIYALEQSTSSTSLFSTKPQYPAALIVGHERSGLSHAVLAQVKEVIEIPMAGQKESLNVASATAAALFWLRGTYK